MKKNKNWKILIVTTLGLLLFSPAMNLSNGLKTLFGYSRVSADTSNNSITIKPADFSKYFKLKKQDNTWVSDGTFTTVPTVPTGQTAEYAYNPAKPMVDSNNVPYGLLTLTSNNRAQVGQATLIQNFDTTQSWVLDGELYIGKPGGADGVGFGWVPDSIGSVGKGGAQLGIGGLKGAFGWTADTYLNDYNANYVYTYDSAYNPYPAAPITKYLKGFLYTGDPYEVFGQSWGMGGFGFANPDYNSNYTSYNLSNSTNTRAQSILALEDGSFHPYQMLYDPDSKLITVKFGSMSWTVTMDELSNAAQSSGNHFSFFMTGSTGYFSNLQQFRFKSMTFTPAATKASLTINYLNTKREPIAAAVTTSPQKTGTQYTSSPLETVPANLHYYSANSSDSNTIFNSTSHVGTGKMIDSGVVINYVYDPNQVTVNYIDDDTGKTISTDTADFYNNPNYSTSAKISAYKDSGYSVKSDNVPKSDLYKTDGNVYEVHLRHTFTNTLKVVNQNINYIDNSTNAKMSNISPNPYTTSKTFLIITDSVLKTNTYYYQNGTITSYNSSDPWIKITQSNNTWVDSAGKIINFAAVTNPTSKNYIIVKTDDPNQPNVSYPQSVTAQNISLSLDSITRNVYYDPTQVIPTTYTITRNINYLDGNDHKIKVAQTMSQTAIFTAYQVIDSLTKKVIGYDINNDGIADETQAVWILNSNNKETNKELTSPQVPAYGQASQVSVAAFTDQPNLKDDSKITGQAIKSTLPDVNVYYNMSKENIKLPFTGGNGFLIFVSIFSFGMVLSLLIRKYK